MKNKVLIITYYWPPSGGGGVQRWLKFTKYLSEFGWRPFVLTPKNPAYTIYDKSLVNDVSKNIEVIRMPIFEPQNWLKKINYVVPSQGLTKGNERINWLQNLLVFIRGNLFVPDAKRYWIKPSVNFLSTYLIQHDINTIITTGPPHSIHLIGLALKKRIKVRWIADFRDPWSKWDMLKKFGILNIIMKRHKNLELETLRKADEIITVSKTWAQEFNAIYPRKYHIITNGFDESDFNINYDEPKSDTIIISHFGLLNDFRNPTYFWKALKVLIRAHKIQVWLFGIVEQSIVEQIKLDEILSDVVFFYDPIDHDEVIKTYQKTDILLLLQNKTSNSKGHIPGKLFEYLAVRKPILAIGPSDGEVAEIINKTNSGLVIEWENDNYEKLLKDFILKSHVLNTEKNTLKKYVRKYLTKRLVKEVLESVN